MRLLTENCSCNFVLQNTEKDVDPTQNEEDKQINSEKEELKETTQSKPAFLSSDEEETDKDTTGKMKKKRKKQKKQTLVYSGIHNL